MSTPSRHHAAAWAPLLLTVGVSALDIASGPGIQYGGVYTSVPLLAAALAGPLVTALQGIVAAAVCFGLGVFEATRLAQVSSQVDHQLIRVALVLGMTVLAVAVARHRVTLERRARQVAAVADAAQQAILAPIPPLVGGVECASVYLSATSQARIGGDLIEVLDTPFGVRALVGDVQGKGMDAVRLAGRVLGAFREAAFDAPHLPDVAAAMDRTVGRVAGPEVFVTAALVQLDAATGALSTVSCGHPAPYLVDVRAADRSAAPARELDVAPSPPLGMLALAGAPALATSRLSQGQRLVLVTDGLLEARRPKWLSRRPSGPFIAAEQLLGERLGAPGPLREGLADVVRGARRWSRGRLRDDLAILVMALPAAETSAASPGVVHPDSVIMADS